MNRSGTTELAKIRNQNVVKSNELIQKSRHQFSLQQQKALLYIISKLRPDQKEFEYQVFDMIEFCEACGIDCYSGKNRNDLKEALQSLGDKSMWVETPDGKESLVRWLAKVKIDHDKGNVEIRLDEDMRPFLLDLKERYTQFALRYTLAMKSKYSVRLYEILKSYENMNEPIKFSLERFQKRVGHQYTRWADIRRKVIDIAIREISLISDIKVTYTAEKKGRSFVSVTFHVFPKRSFNEQVSAEREIYKRLSAPKNES